MILLMSETSSQSIEQVIMTDDELFEKYISEDEISDEEEYKAESDEQETKSTHSERKRCKRITAQQVDTIKNFLVENPNCAKKKSTVNDRENYSKLWDLLSLQLNTIGPPIHTSAEWRKVWTDYKGKEKSKSSSVAKKPRRTQKVKTSTASTSHSQVIESVSDEVHISTDSLPQTVHTESSFYSEVLARVLDSLTLLAEQQSKLNENFAKLNENVEKILKIYSDKCTKNEI